MSKSANHMEICRYSPGKLLRGIGRGLKQLKLD